MGRDAKLNGILGGGDSWCGCNVVPAPAREEFPDQALVGVVLNGTDADAASYSRYYYEAYAKNPTESKS